MNWFADCQTVNEVRNHYFRLAKLHHPDMGGNVKTMAEINVQYEHICKAFIRQQPESAHYNHSETDRISEAIRKVLEQLISIPGIRIEVCGLWIWVTGDTRTVKDQLKAMGLHYAFKKQAWYYAGIPSHSRKHHSMDEIRSMYGTNVIRDAETAQEAFS